MFQHRFGISHIHVGHRRYAAMDGGGRATQDDSTEGIGRVRVRNEDRAVAETQRTQRTQRKPYQLYKSLCSLRLCGKCFSFNMLKLSATRVSGFNSARSVSNTLPGNQALIAGITCQILGADPPATPGFKPAAETETAPRETGQYQQEQPARPTGQPGEGLVLRPLGQI